MAYIEALNYALECYPGETEQELIDACLFIPDLGDGYLHVVTFDNDDYMLFEVSGNDYTEDLAA